MKHLQFVILSLFLFSSYVIEAQQNHFIYIQTENKQSFYVKVDKKIYSSSASGYLLISKLVEGTYNLSIGFPKGEWTEQNMVCSIDKNDKGYLLKNFGNKGWGLFNLQSLDVVMAIDNEKIKNVEVVNKTDAFSNMLSNVVNDSTIRQTETVKEDVKLDANETKNIPLVLNKEIETVKNKEVSITTEKTVPPLDNQIKINIDSNKVIENIAMVQDEAPVINYSRSLITRSTFNKNMDGTEAVFIDEVNGKKDTITIFIPADKNLPFTLEQKSKDIEKINEYPKSENVKQDEKLKDEKFLNIELPNPNSKAEEIKPVQNRISENKDTAKVEIKNEATKQIEPVVQKTIMINSDCKIFATNEDFLKLRKKMVGENNDDDMISLAKKIFKIKCFDVDQVKNLSVLFLKDSGKYAFFDMAYPFVSDSHNFSILQNQLSETYYINRFQVMIRH